ncbi:D-alanyl-D-alanine carboxypeptidase family protein [Syntrophomonas palmitatica]|uniref:D-alanyl-D-alanine carboxypeptidase family protein n=1 Tax=Syntrophomonas palmitatica TaxID=402877 RepID=UPI00155DBB33|nr:D-alanyl-D-alanine carboxypeptidase family protein [Syntrophomonas palmitatica]
MSHIIPVYADQGNANTVNPGAYPQTTGKAVILIDASSGRVLYGKNIHNHLPPASITKIMTALLVIEKGSLNQNVKISSNAAGTPESSIWLEAGEKLTRLQLLYALMLNSGNDAAVALAESTAGSVDNFVKLMNRRAGQLGMKDSNFINPHGLDASGHYTSAYDLGVLSRKAMQNSLFRQVVSTKTYNIPWAGNDYDRLLINHNKLLWKYDYAIGIKTGYTTKSGNCLVGAAQKGDFTLIAVTLDSSSTYQDMAQMFDYGFDNYHKKLIKPAQQLSVEVPVINGLADKVKARPETDLVMAVTDHEAGRVSYKICPKDQVAAPVKKNQILGKCQIIIAGREAGQVSLRACNSVGRKAPLLTRLKLACLAVIKFILKAFLVIFLILYSIRLINLRRKRKKRRALRRYRY